MPERPEDDHPDLGEVDDHPFDVPQVVVAPAGVPVQDDGGDDSDGESFESFDPASTYSEPTVAVFRDDQGDALPPFDERYRQDFEGMLYIGALQKRFTWLGHRFVIRTLNVDELLAATSLTTDNDATMGAGLAYKTVMVALSLVSVDGKEPPIPYQVDDDVLSWARQRYEYIRKRWYPFTVEAAYEHYLDLESRSAQVVMAMGKALDSSGSKTG